MLISDVCNCMVFPEETSSLSRRVKNPEALKFSHSKIVLRRYNRMDLYLRISINHQTQWR